MKGTPFQISDWEVLRTIPRGETRTYTEIAQQIGRPSAVRAVVNAIAKNPFAPEIPCHRVVQIDGGLGGYSGPGGIETKIRLLPEEGVSRY